MELQIIIASLIGGLLSPSMEFAQIKGIYIPKNTKLAVATLINAMSAVLAQVAISYVERGTPFDFKEILVMFIAMLASNQLTHKTITKKLIK